MGTKYKKVQSILKRQNAAPKRTRLILKSLAKKPGKKWT